jgi:nicotinamidase-related amidase
MIPATAFLLIDAQANMFDPSNPVEGAAELRERLAGLLARARTRGALVVFVRNCGTEGDPDSRGTPGWQIDPAFKPEPGDLVLDKTTCDTFASTSLGDELSGRGIRRVVIAGLQSDWCIRETTLGALGRGLDVTVASNGHSTYAGRTRTAAEISRAVNEELGARAKLAKAEDIEFR